MDGPIENKAWNTCHLVVELGLVTDTPTYCALWPGFIAPAIACVSGRSCVVDWRGDGPTLLFESIRG